MVFSGVRNTQPVRVLVLDGGRHVFDHAQDPRIEVLGPGASEEPDIIIASAAIWSRFENSKEAITADIAQRLRSGQAILVLDACGEGGTFDPARADIFHRLLEELRMPAAHAVYLTQNRDYEAAYRAWSSGRISPFSVVTYDYFVSRFFWGHGDDGQAVYAKRLTQFLARGGQRERRFVCLNFSPRPAKILLLLAILKDGLWNDGFVSFPGFDKAAHIRAVRKEPLAQELATRLPGLETVAEELLPYLNALEAKGSAILGVPGGALRHVKTVAEDSALEEYQRSWFTIVTETEVIGTRRVTEKPLKALANFSPFLLWGNRGSLALLQDWGFQTFDPIFDESYDAVCDPAQRFAILRAEIQRLCALPQAEMAQMEGRLAEILTYNAHHALIEMPRRYRAQYEPALVDRVMAQLAHAAP
jgi:hypothetical protein